MARGAGEDDPKTTVTLRARTRSDDAVNQLADRLRGHDRVEYTPRASRPTNINSVHRAQGYKSEAELSSAEQAVLDLKGEHLGQHPEPTVHINTWEPIKAGNEKSATVELLRHNKSGHYLAVSKIIDEGRPVSHMRGHAPLQPAFSSGMGWSYKIVDCGTDLEKAFAEAKEVRRQAAMPAPEEQTERGWRQRLSDGYYQTFREGLDDHSDVDWAMIRRNDAVADDYKQLFDSGETDPAAYRATYQRPYPGQPR